MPLFSRHASAAVSAQELYDWHTRPGALERLTPPWLNVDVVRHDGVLDGGRTRLRLDAGPAHLNWLAEHRDVTPGTGFTDVALEGPFAEWTHVHGFLPAGDGHSVLEDVVTYRLPAIPSAGLAEDAVERMLERLFAYRHRVTLADVERHSAAGDEKLTVAITGSSGLIGQALVSFLLSGGHRVVRLVRDRRAAARTPKRTGERLVYWNVEQGEMDEDRLSRSSPDAVVHLGGESLFAPWTTRRRRRMWESRVKGTHLLARAIARMPRPPRVMLSGSAVGFYGETGATRTSEDAAAGDGFLSDLVQAWESAADVAREAGIRVVHPRMGIVLTPAGGALAPLLPAARIGLAGWPGDGRAYLPWIALDDVLYAFLHLLWSKAEGPVNITAPNPVHIRTLVETLGQILKRPTPLRVPAGLVRTMGGRMARETLASNRAVPSRLLAEGFTFQYPELEGALRHVLGRSASADQA